MRKQPVITLYLLLSVALLGTGIPAVSPAAANFSLVPGEVVYYTASPSAWDALIGNEKYTSDPEIIVLTNGWYLMSHRTFGGSAPFNEVYLYKSTDKGTNWSPLITLYGATAGSSFFLHNDELYLMGGDYIVKSTNNGTSWTTPDTNVFSISSTWTPNNPILFSNRIWSAANTRVQSAPANSNLMLGASWKWSASPAVDTGWFNGQWQGWEEAQVVASPELGVVVMPKIRALPYAALIRADVSGNAFFDPTNNFVALPGGEKKFGAAYDPVSGKFFVLSNPVLPAHANDPDWGSTPELIRNTAAVLTSRDLFNWKVEKIFLYSANIDYEAFQYFNFDFDGSTMVIASRTAFDVGDTYKPPRGHDSNLITFHKIENFRDLSPNHILKLSGGSVLRYEKTQHTDAPLGSFALGNTFAGAALTSPNGMGRTAAGDVYIRETAGRILHFDAAGNFIETNSAAPVSFQSANLTVTQPVDGECSWVRSGSGDWFEPLSWYYWGRPDTTEETAVFGSAVTAAATVNIPSETQTWNFNTDGDKEGWVISNTNYWDVAATNGLLQGTATTTNSVYIFRTDRFFYGSTVPEVRIRLRAGTNCPVVLYWGTTAAEAYPSSQSLTQSYTNNGAFQDFVFPLAGNTNWDGKVITRLRFDPRVPVGAAARSFDIDSITVPRESCRMKGLRFRNPNPYTLSGGGQLRIESGSGPGTIEVLQGKHINNVEMILGSDTEMLLTNNTSLHLKLGINLNGKTLHVSGAGKLLMQDSLVMNGGTLAVSGETPLTFT
ncbi:MAG: sialidase family protein, partial [Kiritimatiellales bacterium]